jgi:hypothetical protein
MLTAYSIKDLDHNILPSMAAAKFFSTLPLYIFLNGETTAGQQYTVQ